MPHNMTPKQVLIIGSGYMANEYIKVLNALGAQIILVGRGEEKISKIRAKYPDVECYSGGLERY